MIGTEYTPELLAALAKTPHLTGMGVPVTPDEPWLAIVEPDGEEL